MGVFQFLLLFAHNVCVIDQMVNLNFEKSAREREREREREGERQDSVDRMLNLNNSHIHL